MHRSFVSLLPILVVTFWLSGCGKTDGNMEKNPVHENRNFLIWPGGPRNINTASHLIPGPGQGQPIFFNVCIHDPGNISGGTLQGLASGAILAWWGTVTSNLYPFNHPAST